MLAHLSFLALGFLLLVKGSDYFVDASARIAKRLGVSEFVIGLTLTAFGTSIPELAASVTASVQNYPELVVGNIVGSNIANIGLIIGIAACIRSFATEEKMYHRDGYIFILSAVLFFAFAYDGIVTRVEAAVFILFYISYILFIIKTRKKEDKNYHFEHFIDYFFKFRYITTIKDALVKRSIKKVRRTAREQEALARLGKGLVWDSAISVVAIAGIIYGAKFLINESIWLADLLSIPRSLIGLSILAIGTSLPELMVAISAARKGMGGIIIGNVLGSNIANILLIVGTAATIRPLAISEVSITYIIPIMLFFSIMMLSFVRTKRIKRIHGVLVLSLYVFFMTYAFIQGLA